MQTRLYELEGQMRREVAERGAVELKKDKYEEELKQQREQINHMVSLFRRQVNGGQNVCSWDQVMDATLKRHQRHFFAAIFQTQCTGT